MQRLTAALAVLAVLAAALFGTETAAQAAQVPADIWVTDGDVNAVAVGKGRVFIGGDFTEVGPRTGGGVLIDDTSGLRKLPFDRIDGDVKVVIPDGSGGWYIGGDFIYVDDKWRPRVAHISSSGSVTSWQPLVTGGSVESLLLDGTKLYLGGGFDTVASTPRARLAVLDVSSESVVLDAWDPGADGDVLAMALNDAGTGLIVGGEFTTVALTGRTRLAEISLATGAVTAFAPTANAAVRTIVESGSGSTTYIGGDFTSISGVGRSRLAALGPAGSLTSWNPSANGDVHDLVEAAGGSSVYAGGSFSTAGGSSRGNIAELTTSGSGSATSFDPGANGTVYGLALDGAELVVAGAFTSVGGSSRDRLAALQTSNGSATSWDPDANGDAWTVATGGGVIFAGGAFGSINGVDRANLAALDAASGQLDTAWQADANNEVLALDVSFNGNLLYVGGRFTSIGGKSRNRIAAAKTATGSVVNWFKPQASGNVFSLRATQNHLYVGGDFTSIASTRRARIASLDPVFGSLDPGFRAEVNGRVRAIATSPDGDVVYIGGDFTTIDGVARANLAALEGSSGDIVFAFNGVTGRKVYDLVTDQSRLFAAMGGSGGRLSAMDLVTGSEDFFMAADGDVQAVTLSGSYAYVGGHFDTIAGQSRTRLFAVNRTTGVLSNDWTPSADGNLSVFAMTDFAGSIWIGGDFRLVKSRSSHNVAKLSGILEDDGQYQSTVALDGADAYWRLGEVVASTAFEEIDNNDGAYEGSPTVGVAGLITGADTAVSFDGNDDVRLPDAAAVNTGGPYTDRTMELWFNADSVSGRQVLLETGGTARGYVIYVQSGSVRAGAWNRTDDGGDTPWGPVFTSTPISAGTTYYVVLVHDVAGDALRLYLNGVKKDEASGVGTIFGHASDGAIGAMVQDSRFPEGGATGDGYEFSGVIDEVAIYETQLSLGDISNHYALGITDLALQQVALGYEETKLVSEPLSYWRMGDPGTGVVVDSIGGMHGIDVAGLTKVPGRVGTGSGSRFDGKVDVVALPDDPRVNTGGPVAARSVEATFVAWGNKTGVLYEEGGASRGLALYTDRGRVYAGAWDKSWSARRSGEDFAAFVSAPIRRGSLTNAVMVFDAAAGTLQLYVDGDLAAETGGVRVVGGHAADRGIGGMRQMTRLHTGVVYGNGLHFRGVIDEVILYGSALTADTVRENATAGR